MFEIYCKHAIEVFYKSSSLISAKHAMKHIIKVWRINMFLNLKAWKEIFIQGQKKLVKLESNNANNDVYTSKAQ